MYLDHYILLKANWKTKDSAPNNSKDSQDLLY